MQRRKQPSHRAPALKPEELLTFIELTPFTKLWSHFALTDEDLLLVQLAVMCNPQGHPVIPDTNGVRKLRFSPQGRSSGKSGAMRCCYRYFENHKVVVLAVVYPKNVQEDLSSDDKKRIRNAIDQLENDLGMTQ